MPPIPIPLSYHGNNIYFSPGQTDIGEDVLKPKLCETLLSTDVVAVACGPQHAALTTKSGAAFTWGCGRNGRLGHGTNIDRYESLQWWETLIYSDLLSGVKIGNDSRRFGGII